MAFQLAEFGEGIDPIFLDDVDCIGNESHLLDCSSAEIRYHNCRHHEDASVRCKGEQMPLAYNTEIGRMSVTLFGLEAKLLIAQNVLRK